MQAMIFGNQDHDCAAYIGGNLGRSPKSDCRDCWSAYNRAHGMPPSGRTIKSKYKGVRVSLHPLCRKLKEVSYEDLKGTIGDRMRQAVENGFKPDLVAFDVSLTSTGVCILGSKDGEPSVMFYNFGVEVPPKASEKQIQSRVEAMALHFMDLVKGLGKPRAFIEDYALSQNKAFKSRVIEAVGALKFYFHLLTKACIVPIGITEGRKAVFGFSGNNKEAMHKAWRDVLASNGCAWAHNITSDELDAFVVALAAKIKKG